MGRSIKRSKKRVNKKHIQNPNNKQRRLYLGKNKRHILKTQVVVDKKTRYVICPGVSNGKRPDFRLFKKSKTHIHPETKGDDRYWISRIAEAA
jgi:hypothetical protein